MKKGRPMPNYTIELRAKVIFGVGTSGRWAEEHVIEESGHTEDHDEDFMRLGRLFAQTAEALTRKGSGEFYEVFRSFNLELAEIRDEPEAALFAVVSIWCHEHCVYQHDDVTAFQKHLNKLTLPSDRENQSQITNHKS